MNYLIQEIETMQKRIRGFERVCTAMAHNTDKLENSLNNIQYDLAHAEYERDEAKGLLSEYQQESGLRNVS